MTAPVRLAVRGLTHRFGDTEVLTDADLKVRDGEFLTFLETAVQPRVMYRMSRLAHPGGEAFQADALTDFHDGIFDVVEGLAHTDGVVEILAVAPRFRQPELVQASAPLEGQRGPGHGMLRNLSDQAG